jgi:hypothetical protein
VLKEAAREEANYLREVLFAPISIRGADAVDTCLWANPIIGRATARRDKARRSPCSEKKPAAKNSVCPIRFERFSYDASFVCLCDNSLNLSLAAACNIASVSAAMLSATTCCLTEQNACRAPGMEHLSSLSWFFLCCSLNEDGSRDLFQGLRRSIGQICQLRLKAAA